MSRILFLSSAILLTGLTKASISPPTFYSGTIGKSKIQMKLYLEKEKIKGAYYYEKFKNPLSLEGTRSGATLNLGESSGVFDLKENAEAYIGTWKNYTAPPKLLPVSLKKSSAEEFVERLTQEKFRNEFQSACSEVKEERKLVEESPGDLNGDGILDVMLACQSNCGATGNCSYSLFLSHGKDFYYAGEVDGVLLEVQKEKHLGHLDLRSYSKGGCAATEGVFSFMEFDGSEYRENPDRRIHCECDFSDGKQARKVRPAICPSSN